MNIEERTKLFWDILSGLDKLEYTTWKRITKDIAGVMSIAPLLTELAENCLTWLKEEITLMKKKDAIRNENDPANEAIEAITYFFDWGLGVDILDILDKEINSGKKNGKKAVNTAVIELNKLLLKVDKYNGKALDIRAKIEVWGSYWDAPVNDEEDSSLAVGVSS